MSNDLEQFLNATIIRRVVPPPTHVFVMEIHQNDFLVQLLASWCSSAVVIMFHILIHICTPMLILCRPASRRNPISDYTERKRSFLVFVMQQQEWGRCWSHVK